MDLTLEIYNKTQNFPPQELYGLSSQMRRAAVSIASNIAEGAGRSSDRDFAIFLCHSRGSLHELETQALIARRLNYLDEDSAKQLGALTSEIGKMVNGLINSLRSKRQVESAG